MASLARRLFSATALIGGVVLLLYVLPSIVSVCVLMLLAVLGMLEFYVILNHAGIPAFRVMGTIAGVCFLAVSYVAANSAAGLGLDHWPLRTDLPLALLTMIVFAVCIRQFPQKNNPQPLPTIACTVMGVMYVPFLLAFIPPLAFHWDPTPWHSPFGSTARALLLYLIIVVKMSDVGAYAVGSTVGRHKLFPRISPGKTWEGLAGGLAAGILTSVLFCWLMRNAAGNPLSILQFSGWHPWLLGALLGIVGVIGDLVESLLKRSAGLKDSGGILPGMGGMLDVLDSLLFASPALYFYLRCVTG